MPPATLRIGIVGLGGNTRLRHVPGLLACEDVRIMGVCNRTPESTQRAADEFDIPRRFDRWEDLAADEGIDAVVIGTWPYLHAPVTLAALGAGKHVLTEARMAMNAAEARRMLEASRDHPNLVAQVVPSPMGLRAHRVVRRLIAEGFLGELREVVVLGTSDHLADPFTPISWRQDARFSGVNMLSLGILHETLIRWVRDPLEVLAQTAIFTPRRTNAESGATEPVTTPDSVHVLTQLPDGARGVYHVSGVTRFGPGSQIHLYGSDGTLRYELHPHDKLFGARRGDKSLREIEVAPEDEMHWRVEEEFVNAIRGREKIEFTDFATGVRYMRFIEAVAKSAANGAAVQLASVG